MSMLGKGERAPWRQFPKVVRNGDLGSLAKTDQQSTGLTRTLPFGESIYCPAKAIKLWMDSADIVAGPLFRAVNRWDQVQTKQLNPGAIND